MSSCYFLFHSHFGLKKKKKKTTTGNLVRSLTLFNKMSFYALQNVHHYDITKAASRQPAVSNSITEE